ncbi:class I SAM-dependent methyltransferase [Patescibacteria group bacterium]|nr:class I SAM-dependent methyltransferase [Patescibacteria group bacterium]
MKNKISKTIKTCRVCGSKKLIPLLSLGGIYVSNFLDAKEGNPPKFLKQPLELMICDITESGCGLVQLRHTFSAELLYRNYWYRSGVNQSMIESLADIARKAEKIAKPKRGDYIIDIGSNDATLFRFYKTAGIHLVGFEPARNLISYAKKNFPSGEYINDFFNFKAWQKKYGNKKAKIITAIAMFYDLDNPNEFIADIVKCLDEKGTLVIQMSYLPSMLQQNAYDNICHEHLEYYSLDSLNNLLKRHNLEIFDVELNDVNGGSFRTYIQPKRYRIISKNVRKLEKFERRIKLFSRKTYEAFASRVIDSKNKLYEFIKKETKKGKRVYVYGASTKGNTLLQFCNLDGNLIKAAADRNPDKWGKKTVGTLIPITSEEQARREKPDYFLILPWHFLKEFIQREKDYLKTGGKFIVPLPKFKIIGNKDFIKK